MILRTFNISCQTECHSSYIRGSEIRGTVRCAERKSQGVARRGGRVTNVILHNLSCQVMFDARAMFVSPTHHEPFTSSRTYWPSHSPCIGLLSSYTISAVRQTQGFSFVCHIGQGAWCCNVARAEESWRLSSNRRPSLLVLKQPPWLAQRLNSHV